MSASVSLAVISLIASLITISQIFGVQSGQTNVVLDEATEITLSGDDRGLIRADQIAITDALELKAQDLVLVANEILFAPGASLKTSNGGSVTLVATRIAGGSINTSGDDGTSPGSKGQDAGNIVIRAGTIEGTQLIARGGNGAAGLPGSQGRPGAPGDCDGFGRWRAAQRGGPGGDGDPGGDGGDGGVVDVKVGQLLTISVSAEAGLGGRGGLGGPGGPGGDGCVGLGGTQLAKGQGPAGTPGIDGASGQYSPPSVTSFEFSEFAKAVQKTDPVIGALRELVEQ